MATPPAAAARLRIRHDAANAAAPTVHASDVCRRGKNQNLEDREHRRERQQQPARPAERSAEQGDNHARVSYNPRMYSSSRKFSIAISASAVVSVFARTGPISPLTSSVHSRSVTCTTDTAVMGAGAGTVRLNVRRTRRG